MRTLRSALTADAALAVGAGATAACAGLLGIDDIGYGAPPIQQEADRDGGAFPDATDATDDVRVDAGCDPRAPESGCCVCPTGTSCVGTCVTRVFDALGEIEAVAVSDEFLYQLGRVRRAVSRCKLPDCTQGQVLIEDNILFPITIHSVLATPRDAVILRNRAGVSVTPSHEVSLCAHGSPCARDPVTNVGKARAIGYNEGRLVWLTDGEGIGPTVDPSIFLCGNDCLDGGVASVGVSGAPGATDSTVTITVASSRVFWSASGAIEQVSPDGGSMGRFAEGGVPSLVGSGGGKLYWLDLGDGTLRRCTAGTSCVDPEIVSRPLPTAVAAVADAQAVYWIVNPPGGVVRLYRYRFTAPLLGEELLAIGEGRGSAIALNGTHVYWAAALEAGGGIYRMRK